MDFKDCENAEQVLTIVGRRYEMNGSVCMLTIRRAMDRVAEIARANAIEACQTIAEDECEYGGLDPLKIRDDIRALQKTGGA